MTAPRASCSTSRPDSACRFSIGTRRRGCCRAGTEAAAYDTGTPAKALAFIAASPIAALYHLEGFGDFLSDASIVAKLKAAAMHFGRNAGRAHHFGRRHRDP